MFKRFLSAAAQYFKSFWLSLIHRSALPPLTPPVVDPEWAPEPTVTVDPDSANPDPPVENADPNDFSVGTG